MTEIKNVAIIGSGSVASNLAYVLNNIVDIKQIWSRNILNAIELCKFLDIDKSNAIDSLSALDHNLDLYIISVPDNAYTNIYSLLPENIKGIIANTSGSSPIPFSNENRKGCGVFYPLQTFRKRKLVDFKNIPILVEGSDSDTIDLLCNLANRISDKVIVIKDNSTKAKIHLAAVFASNFPNYLWSMADELMKQCGGDLCFLENLIKETLGNALAMGCKASQTGPAMRGDTKVMSRHLELIETSDLPHPSTEEIYKLLSETILNKYNPQNEQN